MNVCNRSHRHRRLAGPQRRPLGDAEGVLFVQSSVLRLGAVRGGTRPALPTTTSGCARHRARSGPATLDQGPARSPCASAPASCHYRHLLATDGVGSVPAEIPQFTPVRFAITGDGIVRGEHWGVAVCDFCARSLHRPAAQVLIDVEGEAFSDPGRRPRALQTGTWGRRRKRGWELVPGDGDRDRAADHGPLAAGRRRRWTGPGRSTPGPFSRHQHRWHHRSTTDWVSSPSQPPRR